MLGSNGLMEAVVQKSRGACFSAFVVLVAVELARAGLMPVCESEAAAQNPNPTQARAACLPSPSALFDIDEVIPAPLDMATDAVAQASSPASAPQVLVDRSNSFDLCLYALISLGVFRSGSWLRRPSLGLVPEWYHSGAPRQIGHSHVVGPDALCAAVICFIQPEGGLDVPPLIPRRGVITSLWRCAQYAPAVLAGRAPPQRS